MASKKDKKEGCSSSRRRGHVQHAKESKLTIAGRAEDRLSRNDDRIKKLEKKVDELLSQMTQGNKEG